MPPTGAERRRGVVGRSGKGGPGWRSMDCLMPRRPSRKRTAVASCSDPRRGGDTPSEGRGAPVRCGIESSRIGRGVGADDPKGSQGGTPWLPETESDPVARRSRSESRKAPWLEESPDVQPGASREGRRDRPALRRKPSALTLPLCSVAEAAGTERSAGGPPKGTDHPRREDARIPGGEPLRRQRWKTLPSEGRTGQDPFTGAPPRDALTDPREGTAA